MCGECWMDASAVVSDVYNLFVITKSYNFSVDIYSFGFYVVVKAVKRCFKACEFSGCYRA